MKWRWELIAKILITARAKYLKTTVVLTKDIISGNNHLVTGWLTYIGESQSICPFLKNNGHEAPQGPNAIIFQEWTDARIYSYLKYTLIYNYV